MTTEHELLATTDAEVWAKEFCRIAVDGGLDIDLDLMRGWFANAIETGRTAGQADPVDLTPYLGVEL